MDPDIRLPGPGKCPRCGMTLVQGIPNPAEYPMKLTVTPRNFRPGEKVQLTFQVSDPKTGKPVKDFQIVHEKLFHLFVVSQDLQFFIHDHPVFGADGEFRYNTVLPKPGMYRLLGDLYPQGGAPQLIAKTVIAPGAKLDLSPAKLTPDLSPKQCANLRVELVTDPPQPLAGFKTLLFFKVTPADGLEKYIGAWGHMLAASADLIDLMHTHPFLADGGPNLQFNIIFPRAIAYRVWVQFQRKGVVNTAVFTIPVQELK
ncbi:MAG: heavy metal-binding domain-containing protein [Bryobacteraceae bacterium]